MDSADVEASKMYISYNNIHQLCQETSDKIKEFKPDLIIAIGGGGFIPARMLRTFLKEPGQPNIRIMAIILSLYEDIGSVGTQVETVGTQVVRTQWIDYAQSKVDLVNKNILIIDEVDDTRTTLHYAVSELKKDVSEQAAALGADPNNTKFGVFVLHDKIKTKKADLPDDIMKTGNYFAARTVPDCWIAYPWESTDIVYHTDRALEQKNDVFLPSTTQ
ncbi:PRTase-like protein [Metschnikowia bicuspidata var. bicuspidata NRRL YB-4993]|uniref:PRTase-like protein n=1 Tax=Metschnikowia bicuspidata var. bicuspidata NRRL YB-4993 TaxID=869754 RepID=A0A1A0HHT5_9ASCO|nr:PRTase-like protein [Metschnikowia bicuspidata var. bicuspidata NRRL YB-4993]OBA23442.1 PRTase-like protein [Metschnikowia bicuspidata var. bicuspidata NRRL YB-4993]